MINIRTTIIFGPDYAIGIEFKNRLIRLDSNRDDSVSKGSFKLIKVVFYNEKSMLRSRIGINLG